MSPTDADLSRDHPWHLCGGGAPRQGHGLQGGLRRQKERHGWKPQKGFVKTQTTIINANLPAVVCGRNIIASVFVE